MAELVAGAFLGSFFQVVFDRLASTNFTDYFRRGKLDNLVEELESTLESINQVLDDAEIKQYQIPNVKKWLGDVKHAMYEADQLLDEIDTDMPLKKIRVESQPSTSTIFNFIPTFINPFKSRLKELIESLDSLAEQKDKLQLRIRVSGYNGDGVDSKFSERLPTTYLVDASQIYGRDDEKDEMVKFLLANNNTGNQTPVCSIVGLGGMGKTTFAKFVYNDSRIEDHFELKAWVYVSESFDVVGLTKEILKSFHSQVDDGSSLNSLQESLQGILKGKKYLLVLDDIWNGNADCWEQLLLPFNHGSHGSKIIVTTRDMEVAKVLKSTKLFYLQKLDKSDCWSLFVTHAFHGKNVWENPILESIGKKIVEKCGGLPLAIKTLGQLLRKKFSEHEWMKILETDMWRLSDRENNVNPVLRLSYHNLPSNLKRCFAFCSIFPKGEYFGKDELIKLWMAEGLLKCCGQEKSEEELGNENFGDLESISFFQQSANNGYFDMHDLVKDLAKSVLGEFCLRIGDAKMEGIPERTRHVWWSLPYGTGVDKIPEPICVLKGLRSLLLEGHFSMLTSNSVQRDIFSRLKYLRILSINGCDIFEVADEISNLKLLCYLDLSHNHISRLPDTICTLSNLQTLLLRGCAQLTELPSSFSNLINLRHLETPYSIKKMPKNIGSLSNLQTLSYFAVEEKNGSDLKELEKLNHLRGRICIKGLGNVIDPLDVTTRILKDKKYLEEIEMTFEGGREDMDGSTVESYVSVLEALEPNSNLKRLIIRKYKGNRFPNWVSGCHLPNLVSLQLWGMKNWEEWLCIEGFPLLKVLLIFDCPKLKRALPQHMPSLQELEISGCEMLDVSIPNSDSIIELDLRNCKRILINELSSNLKCFVLSNIQYVEFSVEHLTNNLNLIELYLDFKDFVECPSLDLCCYNSLWSLSITGWKSSSLPISLHLFTNLKLLSIHDCPELESFPMGFFPSNLTCLELFNCPKLKSAPLTLHLPSLQSIKIHNCEMLDVSIPNYDKIIELDLRNCKRILLNELSSSLKRFVLGNNQYVEFSVEHLINCPFLDLLELDFKDFVECPSLDLCCYNSLWRLSITGWKSSSLPISLHLFTNLVDLFFHDCPELESFPMGGFPSNLTCLELFNCPKLIATREDWGFLHHKSQVNIYIGNCPSLEHLPEEWSPLGSLVISDCPLLSEKYKKEGGERWHTISHIPNVKIDGIQQH